MEILPVGNEVIDMFDDLIYDKKKKSIVIAEEINRYCKRIVFLMGTLKNSNDLNILMAAVCAFLREKEVSGEIFGFTMQNHGTHFTVEIKES